MNSSLLKYYIARKELTLGKLSKKLGISRASLYNKLHGKAELKLSEVQMLVGVCGMSQDEAWEVFFRRMK